MHRCNIGKEGGSEQQQEQPQQRAAESSRNLRWKYKVGSHSGWLSHACCPSACILTYMYVCKKNKKYIYIYIHDQPALCRPRSRYSSPTAQRMYGCTMLLAIPLPPDFPPWSCILISDETKSYAVVQALGQHVLAPSPPHPHLRGS